MMLNTAKARVHELIASLGYSVQRNRPEANFASIRLVLALFEARNRPATFVQIGACDGKVLDPVYDTVSRGFFDAVLVEPVPASFQSLQEAYAGSPRVTLVNAALASEPGTVPMFTVRREGRWQDSVWAPQWSSLSKNHLLRHGVREEEIERVTVPSLTLADLAQKAPRGKIDVLLVDAEGYDAKIVEMALRLRDLPAAIYFEHVHLRCPELTGLFRLLDRAQYSWSYDRDNVLCLHSNFVVKL
jgi:FkbM family methyltransferase